MKYLCLVYMEPNVFDGWTPERGQALVNRAMDYDVELRKAGQFVAADALEPVSTAQTVRVRDGKALVTDGPFAETREILGGFVLIEAQSMDEAVAVARKMPMAEVGSIEVRPILQLQHS
jgi:hypothetical protein